MGADGSGVIAAVGRGVSGWQPGDRVLIDPLLTCGDCEHCRIGKVVFCPALSVLGGPSDGTLAELLAVPARNLHRVPAHLTLTQAAALPMAQANRLDPQPADELISAAMKPTCVHL
jgi:L-gulonate 5-dehydrogenase